MSEELVVRFLSALEAGDIDEVRAIYSPDALIWHNDDLIEQSVEDNRKVLAGLHRAVSGLRYDVIRRALLPDGVLQQHVPRGKLQGGTDVELHAAMYLQVKDGHITRIEEYLDSGKRASIRAAREALATARSPGIGFVDVGIGSSPDAHGGRSSAGQVVGAGCQ
jgi:uncharacterized protein